MNQPPSPITKDRLIAEVNTVVAETEQLLRSVTSAGTEKAGALKVSVEQTLASANERLAQIRDESTRQISAAARATDLYVHESPWRAVGIVAALATVGGLIAGLLIARR